jgi:hypothetical protein
MKFIYYNDDTIKLLTPLMEKIYENRTISDLISKEWDNFRILLRGYSINDKKKFDYVSDQIRKLGDIRQILYTTGLVLDTKDIEKIKVSYDYVMEYINNNPIRRELKRKFKTLLLRFHKYDYGNWTASFGKDLQKEINTFVESRIE